MKPGVAAVAAVVVNYNAAGHLGPCLASLRQNGVSRVVVVDNDSTDASRAVVSQTPARWLPAGANLGYGAAANLGAASIEPEEASYLLVCNPDLELATGAVARLVATLDSDPTLGAVGPAIRNPDGSLYPSARSFPDLIDAMGHGLLGLIAPRNPFTRRYRMLDWDHRARARVDWVSGACFLVRREAWEAVGGFDTTYFMYMEDVDLCWRIGRAGWGVVYEPGAQVVHVQGVSADRHPYRMLVEHHRSMWRFAWRTTTGAKRLALPVVAAGLLGRVVFAAALHRFGRAQQGAIKPSTGDRSPRPLP